MSNEGKQTTILRVRPPFFDPAPDDGSPYIADVRTFDVPETIAACIRNAAPGLVAITLSRYGGARMAEAAEREAAKRGAKVIWWWGPGTDDAAGLEAAVKLIYKDAASPETQNAAAKPLRVKEPSGGDI